MLKLPPALMHPGRLKQDLLRRHRPDTFFWKCTDPAIPNGVDPFDFGRIPGQWRKNGQPMTGIYTRPSDDRIDRYGRHDEDEFIYQIDQMAVLNGWRAGYWRGPLTMIDWSSPLVSYWNPLLAQGDSRVGLRTWLDWDEYTVDAVVNGWKPAGYLACNDKQAREYVARIEDSEYPIEYEVGHGGMSLGRTEPIGTLFPDLADLITLYSAVLPADLYMNEVLPLHDAKRWRPCDMVTRDGFPELEDGPRPILGLALGYPPMVTAGSMLRPGPFAERGSIPN